MAGDMRPSCWTAGDPAALPPRHPDCDWCFDRAASCRAYGPDMKPPTEFPRECEGCARKGRDEGIRNKDIEPYERRKGRAA
jgi:hypothetical protein